jgi:GT2 family glycosyltransferase
MEAPRLLHTVVVLNWHGRSDTMECVESLVVGSPEVSVLVVDNGSFDGTLGEVNSRWPPVATLQLDQNLGFSGGMNRGLQHALDHGADVVTVLNNDTIIPGGVMAVLRDAAGDDLAVSPEVMYRASPGETWFGGGTFDVDDAFPRHTPTEDLDPCRAGLRETPLLAGCCITATRAAWQRAGVFDERFFLYFEDSEWSVRARTRGIRLAVVCDARILHSVSASFTGAAATLGTFYYVRNGLLFNRSVGGGVASKLRFIRRATSGSLGGRTAREVVRALVVVGWGAAAHAVRRYGAAPTAMQRLAARWNGRRQTPPRPAER